MDLIHLLTVIKKTKMRQASANSIQRQMIQAFEIRNHLLPLNY